MPSAAAHPTKALRRAEKGSSSDIGRLDDVLVIVERSDTNDSMKLWKDDCVHTMFEVVHDKLPTLTQWISSILDEASEVK